jgi:ankyrin repeat protein
MWSAATGDLADLKLLIAGSDLNAAENDGFTALLIAVDKDQAECVQALIAAHADVNAKTKDGRSALRLAKSDRVLALLRAAGAQP